MTHKLILFLLILLPVSMFAQDISFTAQAPRQVMVGQQFQIVFTVNDEGSNFISPEIKHFDVLAGPMMQNGSSTVINNGKVQTSITTSYVFILAASEPGTFTIPGATITAKGKRFVSEKLTIAVVNQDPKAAQPNARDNRTQSEPIDNVGKDIFIKAVVNKNNPYQGEQIIVTYKLYTPTNRLQISQPEKIPSYQGFWAQDLMKDATQYPQYNEVIGGKKYIVVELRKAALFPQKSGLLTIDPLVQNVIYQVKVKGRNPFGDDPFFGNDPFFKNIVDDSFLGNDFQNINKTVHSISAAIQVKPLPSNKPVDFTGTVGQFSMKVSTDRSEVNTNEAITYRITFTGTGNLNLIEKPIFNFPPDFEVYDPKIVDNIKTSGGISGTRTFEYLIIPRAPGEFKIEPVHFSYFNLADLSYKVLTSEELKLKVHKGTGTSAPDNVAQNTVKYLYKDIRYLMDTPLYLHPAGKVFFGSTLYWLLLIGIVLVFIVFVILLRRNERLMGDVKLMQRKKATKIATRRLRKAKNLLDTGKREAFHEETSSALWGYISHKFNIPLVNLSMDTAREELEKRKVANEHINRFLEALKACDYARYAPKDTALNMHELYTLAVQAIVETEQNLK